MNRYSNNLRWPVYLIAFLFILLAASCSSRNYQYDKEKAYIYLDTANVSSANILINVSATNDSTLSKRDKKRIWRQYNKRLRKTDRWKRRNKVYKPP